MQPNADLDSYVKLFNFAIAVEILARINNRSTKNLIWMARIMKGKIR